MRPRRLAALLIIPVVLAAGLTVSPASVVPAAQAATTTLVSESFGGTTVTDPGWVPTGGTCLTRAAVASSLGVCTSRQTAPQPSVSPGFAQLTDNVIGRSGGLLYNRPIPSSGGLDITFDEYQYADAVPFYGTGEGISFFLTDGSKNLTATGAGTALGYAQNSASPGVDGAYLGLGLDATGNFSSSADGKGAGCSNPGTLFGASNSLVLRGPGQGQVGYCYLAGTTLSLLGLPLGGQVRSSTGRAIRVTVSADPLPLVVVYASASSNVIPTTEIVRYQMTTPAPPTFKFGFAGVNGAVRDTHLVSNVVVSSIAPLPRFTLTTQVDRTIAQPASYKEGDLVPYQFVATNTSGTAALTSLVVTDSKVTAVSCPTTTIAARSSVVCTGTHKVTAAEAVASPATLTNSTTATAQEGPAPFVSNTSSATVALATPTPSMTLVKSASLVDANANAKADIGERINYSFLVRNTGNVTVGGITITDPRVSGLTPNPVSIAPGAQATVTAAPYVVSGANIAAGSPITNSATARGATGSGAVVITSASTTSTPINYAPAVALASTVVLAPGSTAAIGQTVNYSFTATNTGNVPLTGVTISAPLSGLSSLSYAWPGSAGALSVGQTVTATATYVLKRADVDAGVLNTTATVLGTPPTGAAVSANISPSLTIAAAPAITLSKSAMPAVAQSVGQVVTFSFVAKNTGNVTLSSVAIVDSLQGVSTIAYGTWPATVGSLGAGQSVAATATYSVTSVDVATNVIANTAIVSGTPPVGSVVQGSGAVSVGVYPDPVSDAVSVIQGESVTFNVLLNDGGASVVE
jgi:uncharacterized repeat protein (TIGR01451 family)